MAKGHDFRGRSEPGLIRLSKIRQVGVVRSHLRADLPPRGVAGIDFGRNAIALRLRARGRRLIHMLGSPVVGGILVPAAVGAFVLGVALAVPVSGSASV